MLSIDRLLSIHIQKCLNISEGLLGNNYHNYNYFKKAIENNHGLVVIQNEKIIGFLIYKFLSPKELITFFKIDSQEKTGCIDSICIAPENQKKGIGSSLIQRAQKELFAECNQIIVLAWKHGKTINLENLLINAGFNKKHTIRNLWTKACEKNEFTCPVKEEKCICKAILFVKHG